MQEDLRVRLINNVLIWLWIKLFVTKCPTILTPAELLQEMALCPLAPSHYLNHFWLWIHNELREFRFKVPIRVKNMTVFVFLNRFLNNEFWTNYQSKIPEYVPYMQLPTWNFVISSGFSSHFLLSSFKYVAKILQNWGTSNSCLGTPSSSWST